MFGKQGLAWAVAFAVALASLSSSALAGTIGDRSALNSEFERLYADYAAGVRQMDQARWQKYLTPDFVMLDTDGKLHTAAEMRKYQDINTRTTKRVISYSNTIEALTPARSDEVAVIVFQQYARIQAPLDRPSEGHEIRTSVVQREWWRRTGKSWRQFRVEEILKGPVYFDGKIMTD